MRVTLQASGGFTGRRLNATLDTDDPAHLRALDQLRAADQPPSRASAQPRYRLTVHDPAGDPAGDHVTELAESDVPAALRPLITELLRHAHP